VLLEESAREVSSVLLESAREVLLESAREVPHDAYARKSEKCDETPAELPDR